MYTYVSIYTQVIIVDHSTTAAEAASHSGGRSGAGGDILWRWGNPQNYGHGSGREQVLFMQHNAHWVTTDLEIMENASAVASHHDNHNLLIFNNQESFIKPTNSAVLELQLPGPAPDTGRYPQPSADGKPFGPTSPVWVYQNESFYAQHISGSQRLPNGHTLIANGETGEVLETTINAAKAAPVWDFLSSLCTSLPPAQRRDCLFRVYRYPLTYRGFAGRDVTSRTECT